MTESKIVATERLRREGRWEQASAYRDEVRYRFKSEGKTRQEASQAAWQAMLDTFPPLPPVAASSGTGPTLPAEHVAQLAALAQRTANDPPNLNRDVRWVYANLANPTVTPDGAPSVGAWAMLGWAKQSPARFFEQMLPKAMNGEAQATPPLPRPVEPSKPEPDHEALARIDRMLEACGAIAEGANWDALTSG